VNIVHVYHHFSPCVGGAETVILEYAQRMVKHGIPTRVVCLNRCPNGKDILPEIGTVHGIPVKRIPFLDLKYYKVAFSVLTNLGNADIIHVHGLGFFSDILLLFKPLHGKKVIVSTYGGIFHTKKLSFLKQIYFKVFNRLLFRFADAIISIGANDTELFSEIVPAHKLKQIDIGVDMEKLLSLSLTKKKNTFLYVGRLSKNKNLEQLVKVFSQAIQKDKRLKLYVVGKDFDGTHAQLKKLVNENRLEKNVLLTGPVTDTQLQQLYRESDFFVSASQYESFGISTVEGMAAGLIPLISPLPTFKTFVTHKQNGFIVDFENTQKAVRTVLSAATMNASEKQGMRKKARSVAQQYSWNSSYDKLVKLYTRIAAH